jgi:formate dehydrogenase major subunit
VPHDWLKKRFKDEKMMGKKGFTVGRWYEGVLMDVKALGQDTNVKAAFYWGHSIGSQSQMDRVKKALEKVELLVDIDPFVTTTTTLPDRQDGVYLLPAASVYEQSGSVTNSNRDIQWRNKLVDPVFESRTDLSIVLELANKLGFGKEYAKTGGTINKAWNTSDPEKLAEDIVAEWNMGMRTIGMVGQTVKRMKRQQKLAHTFNVGTKMAEGGAANGEQWGLPWPCWTDKHPGTQILYNVDIPVSKGGLGFRARWGPKAKDDKRTLLAGSGSAPVGSSINGGYPEAKAWKTDLTDKVFNEAIAKGLAPYGNGRARMRIWGWDDQVPTHREPIHTPRFDLVSKFPTYNDVLKDHYRLPTLYKSLQLEKWGKEYPVLLSTGRQVEFEGGGNAERAMWWLVELQPEMYAEIHPKLANDHNIRHGDLMLIESPEDLDDRPSFVKVKAKVTRRVPTNMVYLPFHWGGSFEGKSFTHKYPEGHVPYGVGESANVVTNYGYDRITQIQETKGGLCRISKA